MKAIHYLTFLLVWWMNWILYHLNFLLFFLFVFVFTKKKKVLTTTKLWINNKFLSLRINRVTILVLKKKGAQRDFCNTCFHLWFNKSFKLIKLKILSDFRRIHKFCTKPLHFCVFKKRESRENQLSFSDLGIISSIFKQKKWALGIAFRLWNF